MADEAHWLRKNATTLVALLVIFGLALFLRTYFVWGEAMPDRLYSGGSDSYYHAEIIRHAYTTGHQLVRDPMLNYPYGLINPRPPMFQWWALLTGYVISPAFPDPWTAITYSFLLSTAIFGALTIFPTYALLKEAFNDRRAGLIAAFLLAVSPAHLVRSIASETDHDSFVLFFVVTAYFFFLRALATLPEKRWVDSWRKPSAIRAGLTQFFREGRTTVLYSMLAGLSVATVALTWQGWAYAPVILLVYFVFQLFFHRIRNKDTMGLTIVFGITLGLALLVSAPWYVEMNQVRTWFDVPAYLFAAAMALGILFTVTRDYPWSLVVPSVLGVASIALGVGVLVNPALANAFLSGAGYFVQTKLYSTIAEAQAPPLSQIILSFGWGTYFLSWGAVAYLLWQFVAGKRTQAPYLFFVVWTLAAIVMAQSAARFIFNAAPAFAATAGYGIAVIVKQFDYDGMKRTYSSTASGSRLAAIRKSVKPRHVIAGLIIVFVLLLPNVWYAVDASIPFEAKYRYDQQIYNITPGFLRPPEYATLTQNRNPFYFGAFGFSLPHPIEYFPAAWSWFSQQDANVSPANRPAFLSWWDYGFEAENKGLHPTVADNFQNGYNLAGNFIAAQSENEAISLLSLRLVEGDFWSHGRSFSPPVRSALAQFGTDVDSLEQAYRDPEGLIPTVQSDPERYGHYDSALQPTNALYIYAGDLLTSKLGTDRQAGLYRALREATGKSIRYFAVDSRLFPSSASNTGIFYAPMKLSDNRIAEGRDGRLIPTDFFRIYVTVNNNRVALENLGPFDQPDSTTGTIEYQKMFYQSMFYRAYIGFEPAEVGAQDDGIPGYSGTTAQSLTPLPGWMLAHWRMVYRTAYYNPYADPGNHSDAWVAMNYFDAISLQQNISAGKATGVIDPSSSAAVSQGIVFVKYYDGAYVNGTVTLTGGTPVPGVHLTVTDELGVPHYEATSDAQGRYSLLVPFGEITITASTGTVDARTRIGANTLQTVSITVTDDMAMRASTDSDGDGMPDWLMTRDIVLPAQTLNGRVYLDLNGNALFDDGQDRTLAGATVTLENANLGVRNTTTADAEGRYELRGVYEGATWLNVTWSGRTIALSSGDLPAGDNERDLAVPFFGLSGAVQDPDGTGIPNADVTILDETNKTTIRVTADSTGAYSATGLLTGSFMLTASSGDLVSLPAIVAIDATSVTGFNLTAHPSGFLDGTTYVGGNIQPFATMEFTNLGNRSLVRLVTSDATAHYSAALPVGRWSVTGRHFRTGTLFAVLATVDVVRGRTSDFDPLFAQGVDIRGKAYVGTTANISRAADIVFRSMDGDLFLGRTSNYGVYIAYVPEGTYEVQAVLGFATFLGRRTFDTSMTLDLPMAIRPLYAASVYRDLNRDGVKDSGEGVTGAPITATDPQGRVLTVFSGVDGDFILPLEATVQYTVRIAPPGYLPVAIGPAIVADLRTHSQIAITAANVGVSGTLLYAGAPLAGTSIAVLFLATGGGGLTADAVADATGRYSTSLSPGSYQVIVDQNVTAGSDAVRWENAGEDRVTLEVAQAPASLDVAILQRARVTGNVTFIGVPVTVPVTFEGPDNVVVDPEAGRFQAYLAAGTYTAYANRTQGGDTFLSVVLFTVSGPVDVAMPLTRAAQVGGRVTVDDVTFTEPLTITFNRTQAGTFRALSGLSGTYTIALPAGDYSVTVDDHRTMTVAGVERAFRIGFTGTLTIAQGATDVSFDVAATRDYDNSTVSGRVTVGGAGVPASIRFSQRVTEALNATAMTASDGTYSIRLLPGTYNVHATATGSAMAFLGILTVTQGEDATLDLPLAPSYVLAGVTTYKGGVRVAADVTFTAVAAAYVHSDATGAYRIVLPPAAYQVAVRAVTVENGMTVYYVKATGITLTSMPDPLNIALDRVYRRQVRVTWDISERQTIPAGGSVTYTLFLQNTGNTEDTYKFVGSPTTWTFRFTPLSPRLDFGNAVDSTFVSVTIQTPPDALVDHGDVTISAQTEAEPSIQGSATVQVDILRRRALSLVVTSAIPTFDGKYLNYTVAVSNKGNAEEEVALVIPTLSELAARGWVARFAPPTGGDLLTEIRNFTIDGNETRSVTMVFESRGGGAGVTAIAKVFAEDLQSLEASQEFRLELPVLTGSGRITASGANIIIDQEFPYTLLAVLIAVLACITVGVVFTLRRRGR